MKSILKRPAVLQAVTNKRHWHAEVSRPLSCALELTIQFKKIVGSPVVVLVFNGGPSAITRLIVSIGVDPIKRVLHGRPVAQVAKKAPKGSSPFFAHGDSAAAVTSVVGKIRIVASRLGVSPRSVLWTLFPSWVLWRVANPRMTVRVKTSPRHALDFTPEAA